MAKICVIGVGYVGLVTGACFANLGNQVVCLDIVEEKIERLSAGQLPIYEPGLDSIVERNTRAGRLSFTTDYGQAVAGAEFIFIAVNTPTIVGGAGADMSYVESAARSIATHLRNDAIIVNKSTMPVGSGDLVSTIIREHLSDPALRVSVVSNPEFLSEGFAISDFLHPDRVVLGSADRAAAQRVATLYMPLRAPIVITDLYTAEMIKYASNAFLAAKISFINEIARICDRLGADVKEVAAGMGYDQRIGNRFLNAGLGYGGSCFGKDVKALAHMADEAGLHPQLLDAVMKINQDQRRVAVDKLHAELGGPESLHGKTVAVLGLAFKDNTDDMRDAPAIDIVNWLIEAGSNVRVYDPVAMETAKNLFPSWNVTYCQDEYVAASGSIAVVVVTEWKQFLDLDLEQLSSVMCPQDEGPVFIDGRNLFDPAHVQKVGFRYHGIGRGSARHGASRTSKRASTVGDSIANGRATEHPIESGVPTITQSNAQSE